MQSLSLLLDFYDFSNIFIVSAVFSICRDERRVSFGTDIFYVYNVCSNHIDKREFLIETGNPFVNLLAFV